MEELIQQIGAFARGMWKYRWPGVIVAWLVARGTVVVFRIPDQFEARPASTSTRSRSSSR
jgi:hypothetical protein